MLSRRTTKASQLNQPAPQRTQLVSFYNNPSILPPEQNSLLPLPQPLSGELFHKKIEDASRQPLFVYPIQSEEEHNIAGLISMCSNEKALSVLDRILIHFKYSSSSSWSNGIRTCTKVFRSAIPGRRLAWRFLAVNLYNDPLIKVYVCLLLLLLLLTLLS
ncbi:unnamed protein product [Trichobilharzia regenti]|nr:unnamed protein product [Trichobilharzia regenti]